MGDCTRTVLVQFKLGFKEAEAGEVAGEGDAE
jgi:hypothetical protein